MNELIALVKPYELLFIAYAIIYGLPFGIGNTVKRVVTWVSDKTLVQSDLGKIGDGMFWFSLIVLTLIYTQGV
jgi:hypothetical protein